jgi:hypothetical protein
MHYHYDGKNIPSAEHVATTSYKYYMMSGSFRNLRARCIRVVHALHMKIAVKSNDKQRPHQYTLATSLVVSGIASGGCRIS